MPAEFLTTTGFLFGRELLVLNSLKIRELKRKGEKSGDRRGIRIVSGFLLVREKAMAGRKHIGTTPTRQ